MDGQRGFVADLALERMSLNGGPKGAGTLVSPQHLICANHFALSLGTTIRFVKYNSNDVFTYTVEYMRIRPPICGWVFSTSPADSSIGFCSVLPSNWASYLPSVITSGDASYANGNIPCFGTNQFKQGLIQNWVMDEYLPGGDFVGYTLDFFEPLDTQQQVFYLPEITYDSGSPACMILPGSDQLVLMTTWTTTGGVTSLHDYAASVNAAMTTLWNELGNSGTGYELMIADLTAYPTF